MENKTEVLGDQFKEYPCHPHNYQGVVDPLSRLQEVPENRRVKNSRGSYVADLFWQE